MILNHVRDVPSRTMASILLTFWTEINDAWERGQTMAEHAAISVADDGRICDMAVTWEATVEDLYRAEDKAELVGGKLVLVPLSGGLHGYAVMEIAASLREHGRRTKQGVAFGDSVGFLVNLPNRRSFGPDVAFWTGGPLTKEFIEGAPIFAVEVRSEDDYGPVAERAMADKRADYFAAGTLVVWDVDGLRDQVVRAYRSSTPTQPTIYRSGEIAEAEPAVPGWSIPVADLFPPE